MQVIDLILPERRLPSPLAMPICSRPRARTKQHPRYLPVSLLLLAIHHFLLLASVLARVHQPCNPSYRFPQGPHTILQRCKSPYPQILEPTLSTLPTSRPRPPLLCSPLSRRHKSRRKRFVWSALCETRIWRMWTSRVRACGTERATCSTRSYAGERWKRKRPAKHLLTPIHDLGRREGCLRRRTSGFG